MTSVESLPAAGRELDALVAERVMGWENNYEHPTGSRFPHLWGTMDWDANGKPVRALNCPAYSDDIGAAWEVVESRPVGTWNWRIVQEDDGRWFAEVRLGYATSYSKACPVWAKTAPLAICLAALEAASFGAALKAVAP